MDMVKAGMKNQKDYAVDETKMPVSRYKKSVTDKAR
jgi:hypothetical protein